MSLLSNKVAGVVASGPSLPQNLPAFSRECSAKDAELFGVNNFFLDKRMNLPISHGVVAAGQLEVFQRLVIAVRDQGIPLEHLFTPSRGPELELMDVLPDVEVHNLWGILAKAEAQQHYFLRGAQIMGNLPTTGFQAVHLLMHLRAEEIHLLGFDFYSGQASYSYPSSRAPGYEAGRHDFQTDVSYLIGLIEFYGARLVAHGGSHLPRWRSIKELCVSLGVGHKLELT